MRGKAPFVDDAGVPTIPPFQTSLVGSASKFFERDDDSPRVAMRVLVEPLSYSFRVFQCVLKPLSRVVLAHKRCARRVLRSVEFKSAQ